MHDNIKGDDVMNKYPNQVDSLINLGRDPHKIFLIAYKGISEYPIPENNLLAKILSASGIRFFIPKDASGILIPKKCIPNQYVSMPDIRYPNLVDKGSLIEPYHIEFSVYKTSHHHQQLVREIPLCINGIFMLMAKSGLRFALDGDGVGSQVYFYVSKEVCLKA